MAHQRDIEFTRGPMACVMTVKATGRMYKLALLFRGTYRLTDMETNTTVNVYGVNGWAATGRAVKQVTAWEKEKEEGKAQPDQPQCICGFDNPSYSIICKRCGKWLTEKEPEK